MTLMTETTELTMAGALNRAMADSLRENDKVVVYGEDVGTLGGVFRVTDGLAAEFGEARVFDSPLAESGIVGTAIGMAMHGLRPVVEMQFDAFSYPAFEQITSHLAKLRNRSRGKISLPIVIRVPFGGGIGGVEHHSDSSEAYWVHTPGLRVVSPSSASDAYWLLRQSIDSRRPGDVLRTEATLLGQGRRFACAGSGVRIRRWFDGPGIDVTLIGYGAMVGTLLETADAAAEDGISAEVIDLRSLTPFDDETVAASVRRTGRAVVVHEASGFAGFGAEIVARLTEQCFHHLHAPIGRVTGFDIPYPPPMLEAHHLPSVDRILDAIDRLQFDDTRRRRRGGPQMSASSGCPIWAKV